MLEDAGQPRFCARFAGEPGLRIQRRDQRLLHDVFGEIGIAKLKLRDAQQIAAVNSQLGGERSGIHGVVASA